MSGTDKEAIERELVKIITLGAQLTQATNFVLQQCGEAVKQIAEVLERTTKEGDV